MAFYKRCFLSHIPKQLQQRGRKIFRKFYLKEEIYRRCKPDDLELPFATTNLYDISVNRQGKPSKRPICQPEDVLYNIVEKGNNSNVPKYKESVIILVVKRLLKGNLYKKSFIDGTDALSMYLKHAPEPCNYAHSVFEIVLNGTIITRKNYEQTLKKKKYKTLREDCRLELHKMIVRREIRA